MAEGADVDFDEAVELGDGGGADDAGASKQAAKRTADSAGRRLKGRGATGSTQTTMDDKGDFEVIPGSRSGRGPVKCARAQPSTDGALHAILGNRMLTFSPTAMITSAR